MRRPKAQWLRASIPRSGSSPEAPRGACLLSSLRAGSVSRWRARTVGARRLAGFRRRLAAAVLALGSQRGALLACGDTQPLHAPRIGVQHLDFEIAGTGNDLAAHRQAADMADEIAAERLHLFAGLAGHEILADHGADVVEAGAGVGYEGIVHLPHDRGRLVAVVLVVDLADDLLDDVLDRNQTVGAAIFVHNQRKVDARGLHLGEQ